ncbi:MAG: PIN domain nuclease [Myxococcaceae bacterium]
MLVDTSAWIEFLRATGSPCDQALNRLLADGAALTVTGVILQEVLQGCRSNHHAAEVGQLLSACDFVEPVFPETFEHAAALYRRCREAGHRVRGTVDCLIAAMALEHGLTVLAHDRDFESLRRHCGVSVHEPS